MDTAIQEFERYLKRRFPGSATARHYVSDLRVFQRLIDKPPRDVTRQDVSRFVEDQLVLDTLREGVLGHLVRSKAQPVEIVKAIRAVHRGEAILSPGVAGCILDEVVQERRHK